MDNFLDRITCPRCKCCEADLYECDNCDEGFVGHDCGEDSCCCLYPEENRRCDICNGRGTVFICQGTDCKGKCGTKP
jgi:hypothetical protein